MSKTIRLIQPVDVTISQIDKQSTIYSKGVTGRREAKNIIIRRDPITLTAQVAYGNSDQKTDFSQLGPDEQVKGYCLFKFSDLEKLSNPLQRGDKIIKIAQLDQNLFILHSLGDPAAQFTSIGFGIVRMFFGDRNPVGD